MIKRPKTAKGSTPRTLTRDRVLSEARQLLNEKGLEALSMRGLANRLGVTPMALYNHVKNRKDLFQGIADAVVNEIRIPAGNGNWRQRVHVCFQSLRATCLKNPRALPLIEMADVLHPAVFRPMECTLAALREAGLDLHQSLKGYFVLTGFTMQQVSYEIRGPFGGLDPAEAVKRGTIVRDEFPLTVQAAPSGPWDFDEAFEFGLDVIIDGLAKCALPGKAKGRRRN
jgi:AcrR family transcriptional regulator